MLVPPRENGSYPGVRDPRRLPMLPSPVGGASDSLDPRIAARAESPEPEWTARSRWEELCLETEL